VLETSGAPCYSCAIVAEEGKHGIWRPYFPCPGELLSCDQHPLDFWDNSAGEQLKTRQIGHIGPDDDHLDEFSEGFFAKRPPFPDACVASEKIRSNKLKLVVNILEKLPSFCHLFLLLLSYPCHYNLHCALL
jgi:hypothetical protein